MLCAGKIAAGIGRLAVTVCGKGGSVFRGYREQGGLHEITVGDALCCAMKI